YIPELGGVRIEDDLVVTADGNQSLSQPAPADLLVL
ncbi:aminopeptidase P family protein, partial [Lactobacillus rhamnosus]|nr:aminopeptidase P family protein [Lacticaseibacillus rhamnosus]